MNWGKFFVFSLYLSKMGVPKKLPGTQFIDRLKVLGMLLVSVENGLIYILLNIIYPIHTGFLERKRK